MDAPEQPTQNTGARLNSAKSELFDAFDEELTRQVAGARSEASTALIAQIEVLREQLREVREHGAEQDRKLATSEQRAEQAEHSLALATESAEKDKADAEAELKRVGEAGALVSSELLASTETADKLRAENTKLTEQAALAQKQREAAERDAQLATEHRQRAEEQLLDTAARSALEKDSLAVAARAREEALFARLVDVQSRSQAALDAARRSD